VKTNGCELEVEHKYGCKRKNSNQMDATPRQRIEKKTMQQKIMGILTNKHRLAKWGTNEEKKT